MKPIIEKRNAEMRRKYAYFISESKKRREENATERAIEQVRHDFSAWDLTFDTVRQIVADPNYGQRWYRIERSVNRVWTPIPDTTDYPVRSQVKERLTDVITTLKILHPSAKFRINGFIMGDEMPAA